MVACILADMFIVSVVHVRTYSIEAIVLHTSACHHHLFTPQLPLAVQIDFHRGDFDCDMTVVFTFLHSCAIKNLSGVYNVFYSTGKCNDSSVPICITVLHHPQITPATAQTGDK